MSRSLGVNLGFVVPNIALTKKNISTKLRKNNATKKVQIFEKREKKNTKDAMFANNLIFSEKIEKTLQM